MPSVPVESEEYELKQKEINRKLQKEKRRVFEFKGNSNRLLNKVEDFHEEDTTKDKRILRKKGKKILYDRNRVNFNEKYSYKHDVRIFFEIKV